MIPAMTERDPSVPPWPVVPECYGHRHPSDNPGGTCDQCSGNHAHVWVEWAPPGQGGHVADADLTLGSVIGGTWGPGKATRCTVCGARKCDMDCLERRHHLGPHLSPDGALRQVGK
jgi:hypothetical protein